MPSYLRASDRPLSEVYDVALLDLDGVVYVGPDAVPGAPQALAAARAAGMRLAFVTNNAARPPHVVADHLTELGIAAKAAEVINSAQAAARYLADRLPGGARVLVVGTTGLEQALLERGLVPLNDATGQVDAVVQGYSPDLNWGLLAEGAVAINRGALWVATNIDPTVPSPRGPLPGNGSLVAALRLATGREPIVTGKPDPAMHRESVLRSEARNPIVVGDRLDTDIEGANAVGCASLLVLSGVTSAREAIEAAPTLRPNYLGFDLAALLVTHPEAELVDGGAVCGSWRAAYLDSVGEPGLVLHATDESMVGGSDDDASVLDAWRALCAALWAAHPDGGAGGVRVTVDRAGGAGKEAAAAIIDRLGLG